MNANYKMVCCGILLSMFLFGCSNAAPDPGMPAEDAKQKAEQTGKAVLPANVNEAGRIPVLMYHRIAASDSEYDRTPEAFRQDLERLYNEGYRPISLENFIKGRVDVAVGLTPVVITFDDGDKSQYQAIDQGITPAEDCAVGILEAFKAQHPDFNPQATFFVNGGVPFGQKAKLQEKLKFLTDKGYTIGNHTWSHDKLSKLTAEEIAVTIGRNAAEIQGITGEQVSLLALPYGIRPKEELLMGAVMSGSYEGKTYRNVGICNVGWQPELPAYVDGFDPMAVNRIRCGDGEGEAGDWLRRMAEKPEIRYISDGDPDTITVPASMKDKINEAALGSKKLRIKE